MAAGDTSVGSTDGSIGNVPCITLLKTAWLGMVGLAVAGVGVADRNLLLFLALARDLVHEEDEGSHDSKVQ
jgi:hypothetical protein